LEKVSHAHATEPLNIGVSVEKAVSSFAEMI